MSKFKVLKNPKNFTSAFGRRLFIEKQTGANLSFVSGFSFTEEQVKNRNIENLIGGVQIPLGVSAPLKINGQFAKDEYYLPLATTEGALVASVSRGAKAITLAGGASVIVENVGVTRGPVFETASVNQAKEFTTWLDSHFLNLRNESRKTSCHINLLKIESKIVGKLVYCRFSFDTKDAMGMNMATKASDLMIRFIEQNTKIKCISIAGNYDVDKKPSFLNFIEGRGKKVNAEVLISEKIVTAVLKTTPDKIHDVCIKKCLIGSILSGSLGFNSHFANIISAIFAATGQDLAHVTEGSLGLTTTKLEGKNLYINIYMPNLMVGVVGGGTTLPSQKAALSVLGIPDPKLKEGEQVLKFAEIIGGAVLAGELSLLSALSAGQLAEAHERLGRGKI
jgi:hydroxymethylglutaryl-CoA reductase (NADPH)